MGLVGNHRKSLRLFCLWWNKANTQAISLAQPSTWLARTAFSALLLTAISACNPLLKNDLDPAQESWLQPNPIAGPITNMGRVGAINMPTARMAPVGTIRVNSSYRAPYLMGGVAIQPLSRLSLNYRRVADNRSRFERGFRFSGGLDAKFLLTREGEYRPAMALGIDAIAGNGIFGSEYLVASKRVGNLDLSLGLGWGRLAGCGPLTNGFSLLGGHFDRPETRNEEDRGPDIWFSGDRLGLFGSASYRLPWSLPWLDNQERIRLIAEYDSDQYDREQRFDPGFDPSDIPISLGLETALGAGFRGGIAIERFEQVSARLSWSWQASNRTTRKPLSFSAAPQPNKQPTEQTAIARRLADMASEEEIKETRQTIDDEQLSLNEVVEGDDLLSAFAGDLFEAPLSASNDQLVILDARTAKNASLSHLVLQQGITAAAENPAAETITTAISHKGLPTLSLTMQSQSLRDLAAAETSAEAVWATTTSRANQVEVPNTEDGILDRLSFELQPVLDLDGFETSSGLVARQSLILASEYQATNSRLGADIRLNIADNLDRLNLDRGFTAIPIRSNLEQFADNRVWVDRAYYARADQLLPGLYTGTVSGLLEEQFSGATTEILYWSHDAKWAIGGYAALALFRDPDDPILSFNEQVFTGEIAGYYHFPGGTVAKAALVQYLGRDTGIRMDLRQPLGHGWRLDAYLAFSDADELATSGQAQFAETGGADFGVRLTAPLDHILPSLFGDALRITPKANVRALGRDQAQTLDLPVTLYDWVAPGHLSNIVDDWPGLGWH